MTSIFSGNNILTKFNLFGKFLVHKLLFNALDKSCANIVFSLTALGQIYTLIHLYDYILTIALNLSKHIVCKCTFIYCLDEVKKQKQKKVHIYDRVELEPMVTFKHLP